MEVKYGYTSLNLKKILDPNSFSVPNFQRGLTWSKKKKTEFIETLIEGNPFGTILTYQKGNTNILIDGLQRITTIREFHKNPYSFLKNKIVDEKLVKDLIKEIKTTCKEKEREIIVLDRFVIEKIQKFIFKKLYEGKDYTEVKYYLLEYLKVDLYQKDTLEIEKIIKNIIDKIDKKINLENLIIYAITYNGNEEDLPQIFYNLNTGGVKPSKYEVLASLWKDIKYQVKDEELLNTVYDRYESLKGQTGLSVTITKNDIQKGGITLFEYCYAIGSILLNEDNKYISFLGKKTKDTEPIGFEIISLLVGLKVNEANKLDTKLNHAPASFLTALRDVVLDGFDYIYLSLKDWITSEKGGYNTLNGNYMIYHMFMAYIKKNYSIDIDNYQILKIENSRILEWNNKFKTNLHLYYFYDFLRDYWSENRQVTDLMKLIKNEEELNKYSITISDKEWNNVFQKFKLAQINETNFKINSKSKLFIDYLIKFKIKENPDLKKDYFINKKTKKPYVIDIEHIIPQKRLEDIFNNSGHTINSCPVSSLGNLCYLTSIINRGKHEKTLYEETDDRPGYILNQEFLDFVTYPEKEEINSFIYSNFQEFYEGYINFINQRIDKLIKEFIDLKI